MIGRSIPESAEKTVENSSDFLKTFRTRVVKFAISSILAVFVATKLVESFVSA